MNMATEYVDKNGIRVVRPPRPREIEGRTKAFIAAREFLAEIGNCHELAKKHGADRSSVNSVAMILRFGTPEEIAAVEHGNASVLRAWHKIRERLPKEALPKRKSRLSKEVAQARRSDVQIFKQLKIAFDALSTMPSPQDVVTIVRAHHVRAESIGRRLLTLHTWLEEFSDAWTKK